MAPHGILRYRKCVICGVRASRNRNEKRKFMTRFPLDYDRCRQWVKVIGDEDLAYIPIQKLHQIKFVCGDHFLPNDFNQKESRLKRGAIPSVEIKAKPLPDDLLVKFPCHILNVAAPPIPHHVRKSHLFMSTVRREGPDENV